MTHHDLDLLAGEYVLGTLSREDLARAEALLADEAFAAAVGRWQARFAALDETAPAIPPSDALWSRVEAALDAAPGEAAAPAAAAPPLPVIPSPATAFRALWRNLAFWRAAGLAAATAVVLLGIGLVLSLSGRPSAPVMVAVLLSDDNRPAAVVNAFADGTADLIPLENINVPQGQALEIWTLWDRARGPVSIGVIDRARTVRLRLDNLPRTGPNQLFEISLEPEGGSPVGRPTGPVLMKGLTSTAL